MLVRTCAGSIATWLLALVVSGCVAGRGAPSPGPADGVLVLVSVRALADQGTLVAERFRSPQSRCSPAVGCLGFDIYTSQSDPAHVVVLERWESQAAHRAFFERATAGPGFQSFLELIEGGLSFEYLAPLEAAPPSDAPPTE